LPPVDVDFNLDARSVARFRTDVITPTERSQR
jgi:hypothetical protein